jgi:hypothetical protein
MIVFIPFSPQAQGLSSVHDGRFAKILSRAIKISRFVIEKILTQTL